MPVNKLQSFKRKGREFLSGFKQAFSRSPSPNPSREISKAEATPASTSTTTDPIQNASPASAPPLQPEYPSSGLPEDVGGASQPPKHGDPAPITVDLSQSGVHAVSYRYVLVLLRGLYTYSSTLFQDTALSDPVTHAEPCAVDENVEKELSAQSKVLSMVKRVASGLRTVLGVVKEVSDPLPPLKGVVSGILAVWEVYDVGQNAYFRCYQSF